jgi:hypothetical protein
MGRVTPVTIPERTWCWRACRGHCQPFSLRPRLAQTQLRPCPLPAGRPAWRCLAALKVAVPKRPSRMVSVSDLGCIVARVGSHGNLLADQSPEYRPHLLNRIRKFMKSERLGVYRPRVDDPEVVWVGERSLRPADERLVDDSPQREVRAAVDVEHGSLARGRRVIDTLRDGLAAATRDST